MFLENDLYKINIMVDSAFKVDSADNKNYDRVFNPFGYTQEDFLKTLSIKITSGGVKRRIALTGSGLCPELDIAILEESKLIVLMNTELIEFDLDLMIIKEQRNFDTYCLFSIYPFDDGYIVYGEMEIIKLNKKYEAEWVFMGADIFVLPGKGNAFTICGDKIVLFDWNGYKYTVGKDGKAIYD